MGWIENQKARHEAAKACKIAEATERYQAEAYQEKRFFNVKWGYIIRDTTTGGIIEQSRAAYGSAPTTLFVGKQKARKINKLAP